MLFRNVITIVIIAYFCAISCACVNSQTKGEAMEYNYSIPYMAKGEYSGLYDDLVEMNINDPKIKKIIQRAKIVAISAGYKITGEQLDLYIFNEQEYSIKVYVYENSRYYIVQLIPEGTPRSSLDLEIVVEKNSDKIISILQGS